MRRRLALVFTPVVIALALMMPASTLATGGIFYSIYKDTCTDYPSNIMRIKFYTDGSTSANKFTMDSKGQTKVGGTWQTYSMWSTKTKTFPAHTASQMFLEREYKGDAFSTNRLVFTMKAWHNSTLLYSEKFKSVPC